MKAKRHMIKEVGPAPGESPLRTAPGLGMSDETRKKIEDELARQDKASADKITAIAQTDDPMVMINQLSAAKNDSSQLKKLGFESKHKFVFDRMNARFRFGHTDLAKAADDKASSNQKDFSLEDVVRFVVLNNYDELSTESDLQKQEAAVELGIKQLLGVGEDTIATEANIKASLFKIMKSKGVPLTNENLLKIKGLLLESKSKNMFDIVSETERDMAETLGYLNEFLPFSKEKMNYDRPVKIRFVSDQANAGDVLGKTAHYNPSIDEIAVYVDERHPKDIMRSISHELVHHSQNCRGEFDGVTTLGAQPYMQTSEHLSEMERQAYEVGNMTFRIWEDNYKHTQRENKRMSINEKTVRAAVKEALMKRIKEVVVRERGDNSPLTPEEIKLFLVASGHTGVEVAPPGVPGIDVEEVLPPGVTAADVAEMAPEEEEEELEEYQDPCAELGHGNMDPATGKCVEDNPVDESTDREWYRSALNESLIKRFIK